MRRGFACPQAGRQTGRVKGLSAAPLDPAWLLPKLGTSANPASGRRRRWSAHTADFRARENRLCSQPVAKPRARSWGVARAAGGGKASPWSGSTPRGAQRPAAKSLFVPSPGGRRQGEKLPLPPARRVSGRCMVKGRCASFLPRSRRKRRAAASARSLDLESPLPVRGAGQTSRPAVAGTAGEGRSPGGAGTAQGEALEAPAHGAEGRDKHGTGAGSMRSTT